MTLLNLGGRGGAARIPIRISGGPFATLALLEAWSASNATELRNNVTNFATALVGTSPNFITYNWEGDDQSYAANRWSAQTAAGTTLTTEELMDLRSIGNLTSGTLPVASATGLEDSPVTEMADGDIRTENSFIAGTNSFGLDFAHLISSNGENIDFENLQSQIHYHPVWQTYELGRAAGVLRLRSDEQTLSINTDDSGLITNPDWTVTVPAAASEQGQTTRWAEVEVDSTSVLTNVTLAIYIENVKFTEIGPFNITTGTYRFNYSPNFDFNVGANLRFVVTSPDGDVVFKANAAGTLPTVSTRVTLWSDLPLGLRSDIGNAVDNGSHTDISFTHSIDSDGNPVLNATANRGVTIQEDGNEEGTLIKTLNFTSNMDVEVSQGVATISAAGGGTAPPTPSTTDLRYGLSSQSDPALVDFAALTDEASPTDPITISTGLTTAGQYFHIFSSNTHDIQTITDTVLSQIVYQEGGTGNIFTKTSDSRTEGSTTYDAYTIGPLNAGVNEEYVLRFS